MSPLPARTALFVVALTDSIDKEACEVNVARQTGYKSNKYLATGPLAITVP